MGKIDELKFDDKNFNKHTEYGMSLLEKSLRENGAGRSILIDKDNNIIAGNGIVEAAGQIGIDKVKVIETDGDEIIAVKRTDISLNSKKGRKMALADNATASADLEWDEENLKSEFDEEELKDWGVDLDWQEETEVTEDEAPEVNESEPADSELGKVYQLGTHRLMCGDSTDAGSVAILMDGQKADMVFTDPPYNIAYRGVSDKRTIKNDKMPEEEFVNFLKKSILICPTMYICCSWQYAHLFKKAMTEIGTPPKAMIVWDKINPAQHLDKYFKQHELIFYYGKFGGEKTLRGDVWQIKRQVNTVHPTMKPIELIAMALGDNKDAQKVYDGFGGSGSTLIACEQLGRKCYMMELDPKYCDVIRKRYWKFKTGSEEGWQDGTRAISAA